MKKMKQLSAAVTMSAMGLGTAHGEYALNLREGITKVSRDVYDLHMLILWICVVIGIVVFGAMFYSIYHHRKSKGAVAAQFHESTKIELVWTIIPFLILVGMAVPATTTMLELDDTADADMSIKVTGYQWKWKYDYIDENISFFSTLDSKSNEARQLDSGIDPRSVPNYLLNVDNPLVVPVDTKIRFLFTAADVLHSWWVPDIGWKKDTIPGFINEGWTNIEKPGTYRGQCAELCGKDHGFMPIVVVAKTKEDYAKWVDEQKATAAAQTGAVDKEWPKEDLIAKGEKVYATNCSSCHMPTGEGLPGTFPAIAGSALVTGPIDAQIDMVMNGKGMMPAFAQMLDAVDIAAVITYTRNAFGNDVGDSVQPSVIRSQMPAGDE
ncbi:MAG: cytochrome c oxidase subunit II [Pseudomonadota bacterium]